jgi:hypothetical protein
MAERLFRVCVLPALEYGIGLWGVGNFNSSGWREVEAFWRMAARTILGVPMRTPTAAVLGDLGWRMLYTRAIFQAVSFWTRVTEMKDACLLRRAMSVQRACMQYGIEGGKRVRRRNKCWLAWLSEALCKYPLGKDMWEKWWASTDFHVDVSRVEPTAVRGVTRVVRWEDDVFDVVCQSADEEWLRDVSMSRQPRCVYQVAALVQSGAPVDGEVRDVHIFAHHKLRTYALFKCYLGCEMYLSVIRDVYKRQLVSRLRMGVLPLRIESGRYEGNGVKGSRGIPVEFRVCLCCGTCKVEDEIHFVLECCSFSIERKRLLDVCVREMGAEFIVPLSDVRSCFVKIMQSESKEVICALGDYVYIAYLRRAQLMKSIHA